MSLHSLRNPVASGITRSWWSLCICGLLAVGCGGESDTAAANAASPKPASSAPDAQPKSNAPGVPVRAPKPGEPAAKSPEAAAKPSAQGASSAASETPAKKAAAEPLITLQALSLRRDLWPSKVTITQKVTLGDGEVLAVGRELPLYEMMGGDVAIDMGQDLVQVRGTDTDILARASATIAALSPEQLAINGQNLPSRPDLWPVEVTLNRTMKFSSGAQVAAGTTLIFRKFNGYSLNVYDRTLKDHFRCEIHETDVIARARERMKQPEAERTPFFLRSLAAAVDPVAGSSLESSDFVLVYQGRKECPRCEAFAPKLKEFYARVKPKHEGFEAVYSGLDADPAVVRAHATAQQYPGRVLILEKRLEAADIADLGGQLLPLVFLYDANGKLLARNHANGGSPSAEDVLAMAEAELNKAR